MRRYYAFEAEGVSDEVKAQLEKVEDVVEKKCTTPEDCKKILDKIDSEAETFDGALKTMADAAKDCKNGECSDEEMNAKISPAAAELKNIAKNIGVASEGETLTEDDLKDSKAYLEGAREIVENKMEELENGESGGSEAEAEECCESDSGEEDGESKSDSKSDDDDDKGDSDSKSDDDDDEDGEKADSESDDDDEDDDDSEKADESALEGFFANMKANVERSKDLTNADITKALNRLAQKQGFSPDTDAASKVKTYMKEWNEQGEDVRNSLSLKPAKIAGYNCIVVREPSGKLLEVQVYTTKSKPPRPTVFKVSTLCNEAVKADRDAERAAKKGGATESASAVTDFIAACESAMIDPSRTPTPYLFKFN